MIALVKYLQQNNVPIEYQLDRASTKHYCRVLLGYNSNTLTCEQKCWQEWGPIVQFHVWHCEIVKLVKK